MYPNRPQSRLRILSTLLTALIAPTLTQAQCVTIPDCELVWSDEFAGSALDLTKWEPMIGDGSAYGLPAGWGNNELQYYRAENATVGSGVLTITAREQNFSGRNYTSARLRTLGRGDWTYGRMEMSARLPQGQGMWPAFWMLSSNPGLYGIWAASGEIDIMESLGHQPDRIYGTIHYGGSFPDNVFSGESYFAPPGTVTSGFHEYAVEWRSGEIRWYFDGQLYATRTSWFSSGGPFPAPFDIDFHLLLNLAVGGDFPGNPDGSTQFPQSFDIDYVRVYQSPPAGPTGPLLIFDDMEHGNPLGNGWFQFDGDVGGGGIAANGTDLPPENGGSFSLQAGFGSGGVPGFIGGFGRPSSLSLNGITHFDFWINPDAGQDYTIEINLQDDDNNDGVVPFPAQGDDDEWQYNCRVSPTGPCAIAGGGWQLVSIPLTSFFDDNSLHFGGNGVLDADLAGNGGLVNLVVALLSTNGSAVVFRTDYWAFSGPIDSDGDGVVDGSDNCTQVANADQRDTNADGYGNVCDPDLNDDGNIDFLDLGMIKAVFFSADADADFDGDGLVDFLDLGLMKGTFFGTPGPSGLAP